MPPGVDIALTGPPPTAASGAPVLTVEDLRVDFRTDAGLVRAVDGVGWSVAPGETLALVGESGCGKSVTALSVMRLLARPASRIAGGRILFAGQDLLTMAEADMRAIRGRDIAMVFQEPMSSLNPVMTVGAQITEPLRIHLGLSPPAPPATAPSSCSAWSASPMPSAGSTSFRTSSPAACGSGS